MNVIAHRGWSEKHPENTHPAFAAAVTVAGCRGLELDLRLAGDGTVIVCHDATLARFGGSRVPISQQTLVELRTSCPVPTLTEVLDRYRDHELLLELKPHGGREWTEKLLAAILAQVHPPRVRERVMLLCFQPAVLAAAHERAPKLRLVRNLEQIPRDFAAWLTTQRHCHALDPHFSAWTPARVAMARAHGLATSAYTIDRAPELARAAALGLDVVITNRPQWACAWQRAHRQRDDHGRG